MERKNMARSTSLVAAVLLFVGLTGCASSALPPELTQEQRAAIAKTRFKATVGVEAYKFPVYSETLIARLRKTGLFERVDAIDAFDTPPTFVARVERTVYGHASIPLWTILTFGVVAQTVQEEHGHVFSLTPSADRGRKIGVDFRYEGPSTLGWAAFYIALSDRNQTLGDSREHPRFIESLAWHIVAREKDISRHIGSGT
jgi:hypothetical protein